MPRCVWGGIDRSERRRTHFLQSRRGGLLSLCIGGKMRVSKGVEETRAG